MCDNCDQINGLTPLIGPQGPPGPPGPVGPAGVSTGTSSSTLLVGTGTTSFTTQTGIQVIPGQTITLTSADTTKTMSGPVTAYSGTTLTFNSVDTTGAGTATSWFFGVSGTKGNTGATGSTGPTGATGGTGTAGVSAFSTMTGNATSGSANHYTIPISNASWISTGQMVYVQDAGYYTSTGIDGSGNLTVVDPLYSSNVPGNLLTGKTVSTAGIRGATGSTGATGPTGPSAFVYETVDGNTIPAQATGPYQVLMRNSSNTGYTFVPMSLLWQYLSNQE